MKLLKNFFALQAAGGILLLLAACFALFISNSRFDNFYHDFIATHHIMFWVNDGLMVVFFLLISLELKRELLLGELKDSGSAILPAVAALGGMLVPALFYVFINIHHPDMLSGWAIPVATDIAFALGVLTLFSKRVPTSLKLFLMSLAIFDDLGAIIIIAAFHTKNLSEIFIGVSLLVYFALMLLNYFNVKYFFPYLLLGILFWFCVLHSGIHPTIAGVLFGLCIPLRSKEAMSVKLEDFLHPWVTFVILPLFAFVNAGVSLKQVTSASLFNPITIGIIAGLLIGKQIGVFLFSWLTIRFQYAHLPQGATWRQLYGVALLCGIGFTMSLFLGTLAFGETSPYLTNVKVGVLVGSLLSALAGGVVLLRF